jgi:hypothetical protein
MGAGSATAGLHSINHTIEFGASPVNFFAAFDPESVVSDAKIFSIRGNEH